MSWDVAIDQPHFGEIVPCPTCTPRSQQTLDNYDGSVHPSAQAALDLARSWPSKPWLAFAGGLGCGKTHLLAGLADRLLRQRTPYSVRTGEALLDQIRMAFNLEGEHRLSYEAELYRLLVSPRPLLIDDLATGRQITDWAWDRLDAMISGRYGPPALPTLWTTNLSWHEFQRLLPRAASRLHEVGQWCPIGVGDYRRRMSG